MFKSMGSYIPMAVFTILPPEIVQDIIFFVFLGDQYTPPALEGFTMEETSPLTTIRSQCIAEYAKSKITTGSFTDGVLALQTYPRNNASFHHGLHQTFYEQRCKRSGLLALSLTSRWFYNLVKPLLWDMVELGRDKSHPFPSVDDLIQHTNSRLLLSLIRRPDLGLSIKTLSFEYVALLPIGWYNLDEFDPREHEASKKGFGYDPLGMDTPELSYLLPEDSPQSSKRITYWTSTCHLLSYLPNLRSLKLLIDSSRGRRHFYWLSEGFLSRLAGLQNLTELSLVWLGSESIEFEDLVKLFFLPSVRVLYLSGLAFGEQYSTDIDEDDIIPDFPIELRRKSRVKDLILDFMYVDPGPLIAILRLPAALEGYTHSFSWKNIYNCNFSPGRFFDLLYPHRNSLQQINIIECRDARSGSPFRGRCAEQVLKDFPGLKMLGCPADTLKSRWIEDEAMWEENLWYGGGIHEVLPASLEVFKLYIYDDWSINGWAPDLSSLFERKALQFPGLKEIWVDYWTYGDGINDDSPAEAIDAIMVQVEELKSEAKKAGINLEVQVDMNNKSNVG
ncbi:hypothetical protein N431DRAFT_451349 [Stipitochalara longipes BDJ]|nr:hypothetical protein N431DRAFT_451349 [Stipitochalara longipes BDJ]